MILLVELRDGFCRVFGKLDDFLRDLVNTLASDKGEIDRRLSSQTQLVPGELAGCSKIRQCGCCGAIFTTRRADLFLHRLQASDCRAGEVASFNQRAVELGLLAFDGYECGDDGSGNCDDSPPRPDQKFQRIA